MQVLIDWVLAHLWLLVLVAYEAWSLIPANVVASSSLLTWIGEALKSLKAKNPPPA